MGVAHDLACSRVRKADVSMKRVPKSRSDRSGEDVDAGAELERVAREAENCERCPLFLHATQFVMGEGPAPAKIMIVGEQPGDQEDRAGRPFVGPAGRVLDQAMAESGLDRATVYLTNVVKHFKFQQRGKRRLHKRPNRYEV